MIEYTREEQDLINSYMSNTENFDTLDGFIEFDKAPVKDCHGHLWALSGPYAWRLMNTEFVDEDEPGVVARWKPVIVGGEIIGSWPDEGSQKQGYMHLFEKRVNGVREFFTILFCTNGATDIKNLEGDHA